ncbi:RNA polymerase sigma factor [Sessilibacter corallicola]|uniref:RNA polymerase sigma-70 factor (ECF subfamily) n=1 Tax=Sessilibacter corallicola TaxID=2904075 RepID=A0ABQ0A6X4_9GAMM|nr:RNA polymerase sigma factor [Sessilibacter corallicola]MCE2028497.1 RNA polymerase sigma factor [Sessilibacter corallicola]
MNNTVDNTPVFSSQELQDFYQYAVVLCQNTDDAYDILQTSLEKLLNEKRRGKKISNQTSYLRTIIRNQFIDQYRHQQKWQSELFEEQASYDISSVDIEAITINQGVLKKIWEQLSAEDRDILYHWAVLGYSTDEACELLGLARGTFLSRLHRLRKYCQKFSEDNSGLGVQEGR